MQCIQRSLLSFSVIALVCAATPALADGPSVLFGDFHGVGEYRLAARGFSMVLRAMLKDIGKGHVNLLSNQRVDEVTKRARVVHQRVAGEWNRIAGSQFAIGGLVEPDGSGVRSIVRVYRIDGSLRTVKGFESSTLDFHRMATEVARLLAAEFGAKAKELPWFGMSDLAMLGASAFAIEQEDFETGLKSYEQLMRNRPLLEQMVLSDESLCLTIANNTKAPMWIRLRAKVAARKLEEALEEVREWRRDRPKDILGGVIEVRALIAMNRLADADRVLKDLLETSETLYLRGLVHRGFKRYKEAALALARAVKLGVEVAPAQLALAEVKLQMNDGGAAGELAEAANRLLASGDIALAQAAALRALEVSPTGADTLRLASLHLEELSPKQHATLAAALNLPAEGALSEAQARALAALPEVPDLSDEDRTEFAKAFPLRAPPTEATARTVETKAQTPKKEGAPATAGKAEPVKSGEQISAKPQEKPAATPGAPEQAAAGDAPPQAQEGRKALQNELNALFSPKSQRGQDRHLYQALLLKRAGEPTKARAVLMAASSASRGGAPDPLLDYEIGRAYLEANQPATAVKYFDQAHAGEGDEAHARSLARALEASGDPQRAVEVYSQVGARGRKVDEAEIMRARATAALARGEAGQAKTHIEKSLASNPQDVATYQVAAAVERKLGNSLQSTQYEANVRELEVPGMPPTALSRQLSEAVVRSAKQAEKRRPKRSVDELSKAPIVNTILNFPRIKELAESDAMVDLTIIERNVEPQLSVSWLAGFRPEPNLLHSELVAAVKVVLPASNVGPPSNELRKAIEDANESNDQVREVKVSDRAAELQAAVKASNASIGGVKDAARADHVDVVFEVTPEVISGDTHKRLKLRIRPIHTAIGAEAALSVVLDDQRLIELRWGPMLLNLLVGAFGLFAVVFLFRGLRRRGTLVVTVKYDTTAESGLFSLMLARRRKDMTLKGGDEGAYADAVRKGGTKIGKRSASMIKPVTTFEGLPLGRFYVYLYGVYIRLGRPDGNYVIEKECVIRNRETTMVDFDLVGDNATVLVDVWEGDGAVPKVLVTVNNDMDHGIYTGDRGGGAVFLLKPGEYEIQAAKGNKSARMTVRCEHPRPYHFTMRFDEGDETMAPRRATARPPEDDIAFMPPQDSDDFDLR